MQRSNISIQILLATLTLLTAALMPLQASAADLDVFILYFDSREDRASSSGSLLTTAAQNTNQYVEPGLWITVMDQDGSCRDYVAGCGESDDDVLELDETTSSGYIDFGAMPTGDPGGSGYPDIYLMTNYENSDHKVQIYDGYSSLPVAVSYTRFNYSKPPVPRLEHFVP